jgi:hypothetical protein
MVRNGEFYLRVLFIPAQLLEFKRYKSKVYISQQIKQWEKRLALTRKRQLFQREAQIQRPNTSFPAVPQTSDHFVRVTEPCQETP